MKFWEFLDKQINRIQSDLGCFLIVTGIAFLVLIPLMTMVESIFKK